MAAHLLDALVYRDDEMVRSMCRHVMEMDLVAALCDLDCQDFDDLDVFLQRVQASDAALPFRAVVVDGTFTPEPAKSGAELLRQYRHHACLGNRLTIRPENIQDLPSHVRYLIFLDDFAGTGVQFTTFLQGYALFKPQSRFGLAYIPLMLHTRAHERFCREIPHVVVRSPEFLIGDHRFFQLEPKSKGIWRRDKYNKVRDVKVFYDSMLRRRGVPKQGREFNLGITLGFSHSTPNNTLKVYWTDQAGWRPLLIRG